MSKLRLFAFLFLGLTLFSTTSCETDIDIIAPQRDVTVIYGLLEPNKTRHYIRINRAFVGEESAIELAQQPGITEYSEDELEAFIYEKDAETNVVQKTWKLESAYFTSKEEGLFFNDSNKVYYFDAILNVEKVYEIECIVKVDGEDEKRVTAETTLIGNAATNENGQVVGIEEVRLIQPNLIGASSDPSQADRAEVDFLAQGDYRKSQTVSWLKAEGGVAYTCYYRFYYTEIDTVTGARQRDSLLFTVGTRRVNPNATGEISFTMNPEDFYIRIARDIEDYDFGNEPFIRVASDTLQYFLEIADNTLATYMEVNQPVTEILQEQPDYTNINNGIGIFASRLVTSTRKKDKAYESGRVFKSATLEELLYSNQVNPDESYNTDIKGFVRPGRCNDDTEECR